MVAALSGTNDMKNKNTELITEIDNLKQNNTELLEENSKNINKWDELKKDLEAEHKVVKENEKLIQKLEHTNGNLNINNKNLKAEVNKVKTENKKRDSNFDLIRIEEDQIMQKVTAKSRKSLFDIWEGIR